MKRLLVLSLIFCLIAGVFSGCDFGQDVITLNVYNWGEYISDGSDGLMNVNAEFEKRFGVRVNYKTYESNETMYTLLESGAAEYDVVIPSEYMIGKMYQEGMLAKLNFDNIPNYKNIMDDWKGLDYDPEQKYTVPYFWGTVGMIYNESMLKKEDLALVENCQDWSLLWSKNYPKQIMMFDNPRDAFGIALNQLGYSQNTTDEGQL